MTLVADKILCPLYFRESLLGGSDSNGFNRGRVLGKPQETEITRGLDNQGLVVYQRETISGGWKISFFSSFSTLFPLTALDSCLADQDQTISHLKDSIMRQKDIAIAISNELDVHNGPFFFFLLFFFF